MSDHKGARGGRGSGSRRREADPARQVSLEVLRRVREDGAYANLVLPSLLDQAHLSRRDAGFATALTYGTLRLQGRYDAIIARCVDRPLGRIDGVVLDVLRLGAHQLLGMRVATHGAVDATVNLATHAAGRGAAGFVNAVLRRVAGKDLDAWLQEIDADAPDALTALSLTESHPLWVTKAMRQALKAHGREEGELAALLAADNTDPAVVLCARPGLITPEQLARQVEAATRTEPRPGDLSPCALVMDGGDPGRIDAVRRSRAGVEDEGSQLVALLLSEAPLEGRDERWLDLCAGPGGKAALLAARAAQRGARLVANEVSAHRAELVRSAVRAVPEGVVEVRCEDGRDYGVAEPGRYDRVLVDAPCSGLGSLRRRPEARWRREPKDVTELADVQRELLTSALTAVRTGGVVAYVTCSPHLMETRLVVQDVMRRLARYGHEVEILHAGDVATRVAPVPPAGAADEMLQLWPHLDRADAMFCTLLRRVS
ncbi:RsmB/NOP family class I SAM-dependent RNA methyltransferase [Actinomyces respiraculi]|uniref:RsmB/NOP family class I SAM-dependent RNA methyltransferase n=1 Tax=Actinomyces respiraculi TaxID=2744574 RepID=UPI001422BEBB|nr:transcription antitermination factor NusB [Actinomyces respiraculi]